MCCGMCLEKNWDLVAVEVELNRVVLSLVKNLAVAQRSVTPSTIHSSSTTPRRLLTATPFPKLDYGNLHLGPLA